MKTVIIFSDFENLPYFFLVDGNYSHLNEICFHSRRKNTDLEKQLYELLVDKERLYKFPTMESLGNEVRVISTGMMP